MVSYEEKDTHLLFERLPAQTAQQRGHMDEKNDDG